MNKNNSRLYALITGASQGLGKALSEQCARRGMNLILAALPNSGLAKTAIELSHKYDIRTDYLEIDLAAQGSPEELRQFIINRKLPVSILINNAGVGYNSRFEDSTIRENESCILLNNLSLVKLTHLMLPILQSQPSAHILNVASMAAFFPMPYMPVYAPSKAFILNFSLALREELRGSPVSVSVLCPNGIRTNAACTRRIEAVGFAARLTCMDPDEVAVPAVSGMLRKKAVIIPGFLNQAISLVGQFAPRPLIYSVVSLFWGRTARQVKALETV